MNFSHCCRCYIDRLLGFYPAFRFEDEKLKNYKKIPLRPNLEMNILVFSFEKRKLYFFDDPVEIYSLKACSAAGCSTCFMTSIAARLAF